MHDLVVAARRDPAGRRPSSRPWRRAPSCRTRSPPRSGRRRTDTVSAWSSLLCPSRLEGSFGKSLRSRSEPRSGRLRPSQRRDIDLAHLQHRAHDPLRRFGISVHQHLGQRLRDDLPREAEPVLEPTAGSLFAVLCQLAPEVVDLLLRFAVHLERHRLVELEMRAAVQRQEFLPFELELHGHDRPRLLAVNLESLFSIAADLADLRILEHGSVKFRRLFGLRVEPQAGRDLLCREIHDLLLPRYFRLTSTQDGHSSQPSVLDSRVRGNERNSAVRSEYLA